jgi:hypothetical protein
MKQITLTVPETEFQSFMELIKKFGFAQIKKIKSEPPLTEEELRFAEGLKSALREVELHQQGKIQLKSAREFLKELRETTE